MEFLKTDIDMKEYFSKYAYISQRDVLNPQTMFRNSINILNNDSLEINYNEMGLLLEHCQSFLAANHLDYSFDVISKYHECINIFKREEKNSIDHNVTIPPQNIKVLTEPYKFLFLLYQANINKERKFVFSRYQILDVLKEDIPVEKKIESKTTQNDISLFFSLDLYMNYNCILSINDMKIKLDAREFIVFVENTAKTSHTSLNLGNGMLSITHTEQKEETKMITESCKQMIESKEYRILKDIYSKSIGLI